jgi:hypothetical protein
MHQWFAGLEFDKLDKLAGRTSDLLDHLLQ